jgi:pilus assembly protein CpaC
MRKDTEMFVPLSPRVAHRRASALRLLAAGVVLGGLLGLAPIGLAQLGLAARADEPTQIRVSPKAYGGTQSLSMNLNKSLIVDLPADAQEVIVSSPGVASAILRSKRRAIIQATGSGDTNIFLLDSAGKPITILDISVKGQPSTVAAALRETYAKVLPGAHIEVASVVLRDADGNETNRVVLSGYAETTDDVNKAVSIATPFAGVEKNVACVISVGGPQQVLLKVTVAEVSREAVKQLGLDLTGSFGTGVLTTGIVSSQPLGGATNVITGSKMTAGIDFGNLSIDATLRAI